MDGRQQPEVLNNIDAQLGLFLIRLKAASCSFNCVQLHPEETQRDRHAQDLSHIAHCDTLQTGHFNVFILCLISDIHRGQRSSDVFLAGANLH